VFGCPEPSPVVTLPTTLPEGLSTRQALQNKQRVARLLEEEFSSVGMERARKGKALTVGHPSYGPRNEGMLIAVSLPTDSWCSSTIERTLRKDGRGVI
jgi:hypothetical protein